MSHKYVHERFNLFQKKACTLTHTAKQNTEYIPYLKHLLSMYRQLSFYWMFITSMRILSVCHDDKDKRLFCAVKFKFVTILTVKIQEKLNKC